MSKEVSHRIFFKLLSASLGILVLYSCAKPPQEEPVNLQTISESYTKLALRIGTYDSDFVDAYYGPEDWRPEPQPDSAELPYEELKWQTIVLITS